MSGTGAIAYVRGIIPDAENRERDDFYPTPPAATRALLSVETFEGDILEPACGDGAISKVLEAAGYHVTSSDLIDRGYGTPGIDFLLDYQTGADNVITNPPFKLAQEFVEHALRMSRRKVAMLARLAWLEGKERRKLFLGSPLARVWIFSNRIPMLRNGDQMMAGGGGMIAFAWYVWDKAHKGPPTLGWLLADLDYDPTENMAAGYAAAIDAMRERFEAREDKSIDAASWYAGQGRGG